MTTPTGKTGRPVSFSQDEAIERAMQLFWRDGYLSVTARDLAEAMNIQRSSFYNSFGSKQSVYEKALERYTETAPDAELDRLDPDAPVVPALVAMLRKLCRVRAADTQARGCLVCNGVAELVGVDDSLGALLDTAVGHRIDVMRTLLARATDQGDYSPPAAVDDLARTFVAFLLGLNLTSKTVRSEEALWDMCRIFLSGIGFDERALRGD